MKFQYYLLLLIILSVSCVHPLDIENKYRFDELRNMIKPTLTEHFSIIENRYNNILLRTPSTTRNNDGVEITCFIPKIKGNYKKTFELVEKAVGKIEVNSDCKIVADKLSSNERFGKTNCTGQLYPIPNYNMWEDFFSGIPDDLTFYIQDKQEGRFLPDSLLTNVGGMPENFRNGYSKGVAISEQKNKIVYWLIVW